MKKISFFILMCIIFSNIYSQETEYKYTEKNGKLYYNKHLPVYFWVSTTPNSNSGDVLMTSQKSKQYVNPMYFDTEGFNTLQTFTATDSITKQQDEAIFKIYADGYMPIAEAKFRGILKGFSKKTPIYKKGLKIKINAIDYLSGLENIFYSINENEYVKYDKSIKFKDSGKYTFSFFAEDIVGNKSKTQTFNFIIK